MPALVTLQHMLPAEPPLAFPVRLGISRCLLGEPVRYDGGHKRDHFLVDVLGQHVEWVPVCPEMEAGFGTPRESMRLVDDVAEPRLMTVRSHHDHTDRMLPLHQTTVARLTIVEPVRIRVQKRFPQLRDPARSSVYPRRPSPGDGEGIVCRCVPTRVSLDSHRRRRTTPGPGPSGKLY